MVQGFIEIACFLLSKRQQVVIVQRIIKNLASESIHQSLIIFTDGSSLKNDSKASGWTGCGVVIYKEGLNKVPICKKRFTSEKGNNYSGELDGLYLALDYLDKEKINNYNIHIFCDCKPAIISTFVQNRHLVKSHIIQDIQQLIKSLYIKNNVLNVIWCPGHMGIQGNEIADELAKSAAKQSFSILNSTPSCSRNFATNSIWREAINRWQSRYDLQEGAVVTKDLIKKVNKRKLMGESWGQTFVTHNQPLSGHSNLNYSKSKRNKDVSDICLKCGVKEDLFRFVFDCIKWNKYRDILEKKNSKSSTVIQGSEY